MSVGEPSIDRAGRAPARSRWRRYRFLGWLLPMAPALILLGIFFFGPIVFTVYLSLTDLALTGASSTNFVGLANFRRLLTDPTFWHSVALSVEFLIFSALIGQAGLGFLLALLMRQRNAIFRSVLGGAVIAAWVLPEIVAAFAWYTSLQSDGIVNQAFHALHLPRIDWLYNAPMASVIIANVWRGTAFSMLVFSAGLLSIPPETVEAAAIDGATYLQRLRYVILPLMRIPIATDLVLVTLQTLGVFALIYAMTGGGPGDASQTLPVYTYEVAFKFYHLGYGTAVSLVLLLIGAAASLLLLRLTRAEG
ncbi:MAG: sugar ABC transporter permease [Candidatus Dormibacteraeota bacterium]|nr:sugar ABC transporter permease [Candidatus Dormibacteraeota bacterium]